MKNNEKYRKIAEKYNQSEVPEDVQAVIIR